MERSKRSLAVISSAFLIFLCFFPPPVAAETSRGKAAPKSALPGELRNLDVKDYYIRTSAPEAGLIQTVIGHVVVVHGNSGRAYFAAASDKLSVKDTVFTLKTSRCRIKMNNEDVVTMGENAKVGITAFAYNKKTQEKRSAFDMARGKSMFYTLRLLRYKNASMTVSTPTAVAGVRGTKFGVEVIALEGTPAASVPLLVADLSDAGFRHLAQSTTPHPQTNVYTFEGAVAVTSPTTGQTTIIGAGQGVNAGAGGLRNPFQTPLSVSQLFQADTQVTAPDQRSLHQGSAPSGIGAAPGSLTGATPDHSSTIQNQTTGGIAPQPAPPSTPPPPSPPKGLQAY